ncbi:MAG: hypothetical protein AAF321_09115 [Pseudomonadota bacterium]
MPDEKTDKQANVDETLDETFPTSDAPAWTTSGEKAVAADPETRPDDPLGREVDVSGEDVSGEEE